MAEELPREASLQQGGSCAWPENVRSAKLQDDTDVTQCEACTSGDLISISCSLNLHATATVIQCVTVTAYAFLSSMATCVTCVSRSSAGSQQPSQMHSNMQSLAGNITGHLRRGMSPGVSTYNISCTVAKLR